MNFKRNNLIFAVTLGVCMLFGNANAKDKEGVDIEFNARIQIISATLGHVRWKDG